MFHAAANSNNWNYYVTAISVGLWLNAIFYGRCRVFSAIIALDFILMSLLVLGIKPYLDITPDVYWKLIYSLKNLLTIVLLLYCLDRKYLRFCAAVAALTAMFVEASYYLQYYLYSNGYIELWSGYYMQPYYFTIMLTVTIIQLGTVFFGVFNVKWPVSWFTNRLRNNGHRYFRSRTNI